MRKARDQAGRNSPGLGQGRPGAGRGGPLLPRPFALAAVLAALLFSGCGLESVTYYSPPDFAYAGNILTLKHNSSNSDASFLGYDIYYRAYYSLSEANTARSAIEVATNSTSATPESVLSQMTSSGFRKIYLASAPTVTPTPLLAKGPSTYYIYLPSDSATTNWYYKTNLDSTQKQIVRSTGYGDSFNEPYTVGSVDYASTSSGVGSTQAVYIDAFAVAYGYDFSSLTSIYSFPASLYEPIGGSNGYTLP